MILHGEDDFVNMLVHVLGVFGMTARVVRHEDYEAGAFDGADLVIVGPGPGDPREGDHPKIASFRRAVDDLLASGQPFLAVCLGHQTLCQRLGLDLGYKDVVFQGTQSPVRLDGRTERVGFYNTFVGRVPPAARSCRTAYASRPTRPPATSTRSSGRTSAASSSTPSRSSPRTATTCSTRRCATFSSDRPDIEDAVVVPGQGFPFTAS